MPRIECNGIQIYYEIRGAGQPLVFIHGLGSSTGDWAFQADEFSKSFQVIALDLRGHGQSDKPQGPYSLPLFAADTRALLQTLRTGPAHVVGLSLGGAVALQLALDNPELVKTLTIVNSGPSLGGTPEQAKQEVDRRVGIVRQMGMRAMGESLSGRLFPKPEHEALRRSFVDSWASNDPQAYIESTLSMLGWDVTGRLASIRCPTLVISADQDYAPVAVKEAYVKLLGDARLVVIPDAHHATPLEAPQPFNAALSQFLAENP